MHGTLLKFASWAAQKLVVAALIAGLALAAYGVWLFLAEESVSEARRLEQLQHTVAERDRLRAAGAAVERKLVTLRSELETQEKRAQQAQQVIARLRELESWWQRWFGNPQQQAANAEQLQKMQALQSEARTRLAALQRTVSETMGERDGIDLALRRTEAEIVRLEATRSRARHYLGVAWRETRWWIAGALAAYFLGPTLWSATLYFCVAPWLTGGRPIRLGGDPVALPDVGISRVSIEVVLGPGEVLRLKEKFLQASDEGVAKSTRFVLDWRIPFTSLACGLVELVELRHPGSADPFHITLSNADDPHLELATISIPAGGSLVLRPSFLAGVIQQAGERLEIRRHWRLLHWQAWISGQFRFFEFIGPCRLIVAGSRGVRAERLGASEGLRPPARRTNQDATIGFTPNLEYRPVRAETFWSYYRGMNPLFDDLFSGRGLFVLQETATGGDAAQSRRFWASVWNGVLKVFGL